MSSLKYIGKNPTLNAHLGNRLFADQAFSSGVSRASVDESVATSVQSLARTDYVDAKDAQLASTEYVNQQDGLLMPTYYRNVANGVATLDSGTKVPASQLPLMGKGKIKGPYGMTSRNAGSASPASSGFTADHYAKIGSWNIPAPGFLWRPMIFMSVIGGSFHTADRSIAGGRFDIECRVGGQYNSTICASGRGHNSIRGFQAVSVVPNTDLTPQTGNTMTGYGSSYAVDIGVFLFQYFGGRTIELTDAGYIFSASLYLIEIGNTA